MRKHILVSTLENEPTCGRGRFIRWGDLTQSHGNRLVDGFGVGACSAVVAAPFALKEGDALAPGASFA